jgi:ribosomal-protein-alanine N-acetyltransferase
MGVSHYPAIGPARYNRCIEIIIRRFEERDLPSILRLERESFEHDAWSSKTFLEYAAAVPEFFLVALVVVSSVASGIRGERLAGYSIASFTRHGAEIDSLGVRPRYRQEGVAAALLNATFRKLRRRGAQAVWLMVRRENEAAIRLYRKLGFVRTATVPDYYENGASRAGWRMRKDLGG